MTDLKFFSLLFLMLLVSCTESSLLVQDAEPENICTLKENISQISEPVSFDVMDDGEFVLCDGVNVFLYSTSGEQMHRIGNAGKAKYEYNNPSVVRTYKDIIYVWSSSTLRFIVYRKDGTPMDEYLYDSAITDFEVTDDAIIIYTAGRNRDHVIDVYDKVGRAVIARLGQSSPEHEVLLHSWAAAPFLKSGSSIYYCSKDELRLSRYDIMSGENTEYVSFDSGTFVVNNIPSDSQIARNRQKRTEYLRENSQVLSVFQDKKGLFILTLEGQTVVVDGKYDNSGRIFTLYDAETKNPVSRYSYASIGTQILIESTSYGIYVIRHSISDDDDVYMLDRLVI